MVALEATAGFNELRVKPQRRNLQDDSAEPSQSLDYEPELVNFIDESTMTLTKMWLL